jgi:hypothetical protein
MRTIAANGKHIYYIYIYTYMTIAANKASGPWYSFATADTEASLKRSETKQI